MGYRITKSKIKVENSKTNNYTEFYYHFFRNILIVSIPLVIIFALVLSIPHSSATVSGVSADSLTLSLPTSCTLSSVVNSAHNATLISGTYTSDIGKTTITTLCNDGNGYAVYANGLSNGTVGNNALISSVSSNHNIATGIYEQGDTTSSWAMKLGNVSGDTSPTPPVIEQGYNNTYGLVPSTWTKVAGRTSGTTDMITGSSFTTTYAVYTAPTQHAGTYTGQVAYVLIHGSGGSPTPIYFMQDVASWKDNLQLEESIQAIDARDAKTYWVTKLQDGHVWMTQNLDFDISTNTILNSETTDLNVAYNSTTGNYPEYNNGYTVNNNIIYWEPASSATTINFTGNTVTGWGNSNTAPYSANKTDSKETGHASLGNYYNWTAAIASNNSASLTTSTYDNIANSPKNSICPKGWRLPTISNDNASNAGSTNEFARLNYLYNDSSATNIENLINQPLSFAKSSSIKNDGSFYSDFNAYWSSTPYSTISAYFLYFNQNTVSTAVTGGGYWPYKSYGFAIRCVAK